MPLSGWEETLAVRAIQAPAGAVRSRGGGWGGGGGGLCSAGVAPSRNQGRAGAQAAHLRQGLRSQRAPGGAAPLLGVLLRAEQLGRRRSSGLPLLLSQEPGGLGPSRWPQLQAVFVASSRSTARPRLAAPRLAGGWRSRLLRGCTHLQQPQFLAGHAPVPAGCEERRRECTGPTSSSSCSEPRVLGEGKPESSGSRGSCSGRRRLGCSPRGLGAEK